MEKLVDVDANCLENIDLVFDWVVEIERLVMDESPRWLDEEDE